MSLLLPDRIRYDLLLLITTEVLRDRPAVLNPEAPIHDPGLLGPTLRSDGRPRFMRRLGYRLRAGET